MIEELRVERPKPGEAIDADRTNDADFRLLEQRKTADHLLYHLVIRGMLG
jgi:hypothetical protein